MFTQVHLRQISDVHDDFTEAAAEILGSPDLHIKSGSTLRLVCTMRQSTEPPVYVFWYHEDRMINYDTSRGVSVLADKMSSILIIKEAEKSDNGNYTCSPSNAKPASINVHVLNATAGELLFILIMVVPIKYQTVPLLPKLRTLHSFVHQHRRPQFVQQTRTESYVFTS